MRKDLHSTNGADGFELEMGILPLGEGIIQMLMQRKRTRM